MLSNIGVSGLIIILIIALVLFGPSKLPQLGRAVGDTLREFKNSTKSVMDDHTDPNDGDKKLEDVKKVEEHA